MVTKIRSFYLAWRINATWRIKELERRHTGAAAGMLTELQEVRGRHALVE